MSETKENFDKIFTLCWSYRSLKCRTHAIYKQFQSYFILYGCLKWYLKWCLNGEGAHNPVNSVYLCSVCGEGKESALVKGWVLWNAGFRCHGYTKGRFLTVKSGEYEFCSFWTHLFSGERNLYDCYIFTFKNTTPPPQRLNVWASQCCSKTE